MPKVNDQIHIQTVQCCSSVAVCVYSCYFITGVNRDNGVRNDGISRILRDVDVVRVTCSQIKNNLFSWDNDFRDNTTDCNNLRREQQG